MTHQDQHPDNMWPKDNPFDVSNGYFTELPERIMLRVHQREPETSETLNQLRNKDTFNIPDRYFNSLHEAILSKTITTQPKGKTITLFRYVRYAAAVAAISFGMVLLLNKEQHTNISWEQVDDEEITAYLENNLSLELVAQAYMESSIETAKQQRVNATDSSEGLEQYLLENTDANDLMEEDI